MYSDKKDIFWPFYLWRVLAPKPKPPINIFQMLVLKLVKADCKTVERLYEYTNLEPELLKYILSQLNQEGYLNTWELTEEGQSVLKGELINSKERTSYYLIQDALTGRLLSRVMSELPHIDGMDFSEKYPKYLVSKSSGKSVSPLLLNKGIIKPSLPTVEEMSHCIKEHRRALNQLKQADLYVPDNAFSIDLSVELIEQDAIPVFVHLNLFSPLSGERMWYLSDPTGLSHTVPELNEAAEQVMESQKEFAARVESVIGIAAKEQTTSYQERMNEFEQQAKLELLSTFAWTKKDTLVEKHTLAMLRIKKQILAETNPRFELLDALLNEQQKVLEAWLKSFIKPDKNNEDWHVLVTRWNRDKPVLQQNKSLKKEIFLRVEGVSDEVAFRLATSNSSTIRNALTHNSQSLKPMLAAMLLSFPEVVEQLNLIIPDWLDCAVQLADARNSKSAHAGGSSLTKEEALDHLNNVESLLKVLENLLGTK